MLFTISIIRDLLIHHGVQIGPEMMLNMIVLVLFGNIKNSINLSMVNNHLFINLSFNAIMN